jgi:predicted NBD/HSP70 family sugar kinase
VGTVPRWLRGGFWKALETLGHNLVATLLTAAIVSGAFFRALDELAFWIPVAVVATVLAAGSEVLRRRQQQGMRSRGGQVFIGMDVGRTQMSFGRLRVKDGDPRRLPEHEEVDEEDPRTRERSPLNPELEKSRDEIFNDLAEKIGKVVPPSGRLDGIGFGVPGQVVPQTGDVESPGALGRGQIFRTEMAARLADNRDLVKALGGNPAGSDQQRREFVKDHLYVDNDVRSATRAVLSYHPDWRDFACIFVGSGVGAGFVLQGAIYYGPAFSAGEVGHMTVHLSPEQHGILGESEAEQKGRTGERGGLRHFPRSCECGKQGVHWESIVSARGLEDLARRLDGARARTLGDAFGAPTREGGISAAQLSAVGPLVDKPPHQPLESVLKALQTSIDVTCQRTGRSPPTARAGLDAVKREMQKDDGMENYVRTVLRWHARYFAIGVANLLNVLNVSRLVLGGGVMDGLWPLEIYQHEFNSVRDAHSLSAPLRVLGMPELNAGMRPGWAWTGSALLFRDPSYEAAHHGEPFYAAAPAD